MLEVIHLLNATLSRRDAKTKARRNSAGLLICVQRAFVCLDHKYVSDGLFLVPGFLTYQPANGFLPPIQFGRWQKTALQTALTISWLRHSVLPKASTLRTARKMTVASVAVASMNTTMRGGATRLAAKFSTLLAQKPKDPDWSLGPLLRKRSVKSEPDSFCRKSRKVTSFPSAKSSESDSRRKIFADPGRGW